MTLAKMPAAGPMSLATDNSHHFGAALPERRLPRRDA
jgi:hypothetical protein